MTERDLNQIISHYEELTHYINLYTHVMYIKPNLIDKPYFSFNNNNNYYIDDWDIYDEDEIYVVIRNSYLPDFTRFWNFKKEDLVNYINSEFGGKAFI